MKDPHHYAEWQGTTKHASTLDPTQSGLTLLLMNSVGTHQRNELTCNSSGTAHPQSAYLAEPLSTNPWHMEWN